ncbi:carbonic anhydrase [Mactra antiquata]
MDGRGRRRSPGKGVVIIIIIIVTQLHVVRCSTLYQWIVDSQTRFNYDPDPTNRLGVYNWPRTYSTDCSGRHQSPIDIQLNQVRYGVSCRCPRLIYTNSNVRGTFKNNGHSAEFEPEEELMVQLTNIPYRDGMYKMHDFHLHYGGVTGRSFELQGRRFRGSGIMSAGSEHTIDGLRFEGELHFVFYNSRYRNLEEATSRHDGIVVIVLLIQKLPMTMSGTLETSRFSDFLERNIPQIFPYQSNYTTDVDLNVFFNRSCEFYTYPGSTTTPTCHESVRWIILKDPLTVTERAWFQLTGLQSRGDFNVRFGNYRTTQPLNDRVVEANFDQPSESVLPSPNGESALMMMMMSVMMNMMNVTSQDMVDIMSANRIDLARFPNLAENFRNMPMVEMGNMLVPSLDGNSRDLRVTSADDLQRSIGGMRIMQQAVIRGNSFSPNADGNIRNMPMMFTTSNGMSTNMVENVRDMPMRSMPENRRNPMPNFGDNTRNMQMMTAPGDVIIPNLDGNVPGMAFSNDMINANRGSRAQNLANDIPMTLRSPDSNPLPFTNSGNDVMRQMQNSMFGNRFMPNPMVPTTDILGTQMPDPLTNMPGRMQILGSQSRNLQTNAKISDSNIPVTTAGTQPHIAPWVWR